MYVASLLPRGSIFSEEKKPANWTYTSVFLVALLPPANRMRPRSPPPPPPTHSAKNKEQERSQEVKVKKSSTSFYENAQFHINRETTSTTNVFPQQTNPNRKTGTMNLSLPTCGKTGS